MKDAYSFHIDEPSLAQGYRAHVRCVHPYFHPHALEVPGHRPTAAASAATSHRSFTCWPTPERTPSPTPTSGDYASNLETATTLQPQQCRALLPSQELRKVPTPGARTIAESQCVSRRAPAQQCLKTLMVDGDARCRDRDDPARRPRAQRRQGAKARRRRESVAYGERGTGTRGGRLQIPDHLARWALAARSTSTMPRRKLADFVCGANEKDVHLTRRELGTRSARAEIRGHPQCRAGRSEPVRSRHARDRAWDPGRPHLPVGAALQPGHGCHRLRRTGESGDHVHGLLRHRRDPLVAAAIEQNHDANGILWPEALRPFKSSWSRSIIRSPSAFSRAADHCTEDFDAAGIDALLDDRDARPGVKFAEWSSLGIPHRLVVGDRALEDR